MIVVGGGGVPEIGLNQSLVERYLAVGKTLAGYKRGRPLPVLPRIRPQLTRGTQRVPRVSVSSQY